MCLYTYNMYLDNSCSWNRLFHKTTKTCCYDRRSLVFFGPLDDPSTTVLQEFSNFGSFDRVFLFFFFDSYSTRNPGELSNRQSRCQRRGQRRIRFWIALSSTTWHVLSLPRVYRELCPRMRNWPLGYKIFNGFLAFPSGSQ